MLAKVSLRLGKPLSVSVGGQGDAVGLRGYGAATCYGGRAIPLEFAPKV